MIELLPAGPPFARQRRMAPAVYLDHWALRRFSTTQELGDRLIAALRANGGTLVLSWANVAEFLAMDAMTTAAKHAERFIEANWPRLYFLRPDPFIVEDRENGRLAGTLREDPESDEELMMICAYQVGPSGLAVPSTAGIVTSVLGAKARLEPGALDLKSKVTAATRARLDAARTDPTERRKFERAPTQPHRRRATRSLLELLLRRFLDMPPDAFRANDVFDLLHAVVPISYCDFVLLDKRWRRGAVDACAELRAQSATAPLAEIFDGRAGELERFLTILEAA